MTGLAVAKGVAVGVGLMAAAGTAAVVTGNGHVLTMALQHVPGWTQAHTVLTNLNQKMPWNHSH